MVTPQPSAKAVTYAMKAICLGWAKTLNGSFQPDASASDHGLSGRDAVRFDSHMQYLWANADDPLAMAMEARIRAYPEARTTFDLTA